MHATPTPRNTRTTTAALLALCLMATCTIAAPLASAGFVGGTIGHIEDSTLIFAGKTGCAAADYAGALGAPTSCEKLH